MKAIKFLTDYRGVLSDEIFYEAGAVVELAKASVLVADGRAEYFDNPPPFPIEPKSVKADDLKVLELQTLRDMAKEAGIKNYWNMRQETLIMRLSGV